MKNDYYVYVYIDPRNFEEFYYGKGKGSRKEAHLVDVSDNEKTQRIAAIRKDGVEPIIRVIAAGLNEHDALLVEATLLWKLGKYTTNVASGHYQKNFREHDTLHQELSGFDYQNGLYYFNVGECERRNWDDCLKFGFISAGGGPSWREQIIKFQPGDIVLAYLKRFGFVGVGRVKKSASMIREVRLNNGKRILDLPLVCSGMSEGSNDPDLSEYVVLVDWIKAVPREQAKWSGNSGLYTTQKVRASLDNQPKTIKFAEAQFGISDIRGLVK